MSTRHGAKAAGMNRVRKRSDPADEPLPRIVPTLSSVPHSPLQEWRPGAQGRGPRRTAAGEGPARHVDTAASTRDASTRDAWRRPQRRGRLTSHARKSVQRRAHAGQAYGVWTGVRTGSAGLGLRSLHRRVSRGAAGRAAASGPGQPRPHILQQRLPCFDDGARGYEP